MLLSFLAMTISPISSADEKLRELPVPSVSATIMPPVISPVKKGQLVPFDGIILNMTAAAQITVDKENAKKECDLLVKEQVDKQKAFDDTSLKDKNSELEYTKNTLGKQLKDREDQINEMRKENVSSSSSGLTWGIVGTAGGVILTVSIVFLVSLAKK